MLERGWKLHEVQRVLGHKDAATTSRYTNATDDQIIEAMRRFGVQPLHVVAQSTEQEPPPPVQDDSSLSANVVIN